MSLGTHVTNCTLDAPGYGRMNLVATMFGHGLVIRASEEGQARARKTFYPKVRSSGEWRVEFVFRSRAERDVFNLWIARYWGKISNPRQAMLMPMTVRIPRLNFEKVGYPTSEIESGDTMGEYVYMVVMGFTSASDPEITASLGSRYAPPLRDTAARAFYPAGTQSSDAVITEDEFDLSAPFIRRF